MLQDNPNKPTNNGYEILERLTGISKTEQMKIMS